MRTRRRSPVSVQLGNVSIVCRVIRDLRFLAQILKQAERERFLAGSPFDRTKFFLNGSRDGRRLHILSWESRKNSWPWPRRAFGYSQFLGLKPGCETVRCLAVYQFRLIAKQSCYGGEILSDRRSSVSTHRVKDPLLLDSCIGDDDGVKRDPELLTAKSLKDAKGGIMELKPGDVGSASQAGPVG